MTRDPQLELLLGQVMMRSALKLLAALRIEPPDVEGRGRAAETLRLSVAPIWSVTSVLDLEIDDEAILWHGQPVLEAADDTEGLIAALRQGGVARLALMPGAEASELLKLLLAVHRARARGAVGVDLATLLFQADLQLVRYQLESEAEPIEADPVEPTPRPAPPRGAPEATRAGVRDAVRADAAETPDRGLVQLEKFDSTLYFLDRREIEYLRGAVEREYRRDLAGSALALLLDTLQLRSDPEVRGEAIAVLADLLPHLLASGRFDGVAYLIGETRRISQEVDLVTAHKEALDALRASVSEPRAIAQLFHALDEGGGRPTAESVGLLLRELRPQAIRQVLGWSDILADSDAKRAVTEALEAFFQQWPHALSRMLATNDREAVHAALELAIRLRLPGFVEAVAEIAQHPDPATRALVARAFAAIGSSAALRHLLALAADDHRDVRLEVWRTFAARPHRGSLKTLEQAVTGRRIEELGRKEKRTLFQAYATVAGPAATETLVSLLDGKSPSRVRLSAHTRACACVGLGLVGTPPARVALERAAKDRDPVVRAAAGEALRGGAAR